MRKITDEELISFFNNLKEIIQAQKELNHILHKRITNLEGWVYSNSEERLFYSLWRNEKG